MIPARQRLEAGNGAILEPHDRLVQYLYLLALDGAAQFRLHREPIGLARAHSRLEYLDAVAANALGVVHRELGILKRPRGAVRLVFGQRQPDRGGEEDLAFVERDRRAQRAPHGFGEGDDARGLFLRYQDQRELIAGEPCQRILWLEQTTNPARNGEQDRVTDRDADRIVDLLEAIEIDHDH